MTNIKPRKPAGTFLNDHTSSINNLYHQDTRNEGSSYDKSLVTTITSNRNSNTNFIAERALPKVPRAVSVSQTGERHSLQLENYGNADNSNSVGSFLTEKLDPSGSNTANISKSLTTVPNLYDRTRSSSIKRSRGIHRYINQKPKPMFTPRNLERVSLPRSLSEDRQIYSRNFQTQTDIHSAALPALLQKRTSHSSAPIIKKNFGYAKQPLQSHPKCECDNVGDMFVERPPLQPLRILTTNKKSKLKDFSELRGIVSALTLITVVSWFFSIFFELEGIADAFSSLVNAVQEWFVRREKPMTTAERCVQYVRSWWT